MFIWKYVHVSDCTQQEWEIPFSLSSRNTHTTHTCIWVHRYLCTQSFVYVISPKS